MRGAAPGARAAHGIERLAHEDPVLFGLLERESLRQASVLSMVASSSVADPSVLSCAGSDLSNVTTEGYPGARYHAGCAVVDEVERLAIERAKSAFGARYANVQPHSGTSANAVVMFSLLQAGDTIMGLDLSAGGHLSHGSRASVSGRYFNAVSYGVGSDGRIDYDAVRLQAATERPRLIVCGASAYPRVIDFKRFRAIADDVGAFLLADISHIAGLIVAGQHPSPIDHAHFTTTSTYKQLMGPRGGLILSGRDSESPAPNGQGTLAQMLQNAVFPYFQGTPNLSGIAAKARALAMVATPDFKDLAQRIVASARSLAERLSGHGYPVITGGSDNHIVLIDVQAKGITGLIAERALEECDIIVNKNLIPGDRLHPKVTSGVRLGTNIVAQRRMGVDEMRSVADLIHGVLSAVAVADDRSYVLDSVTAARVRAEVQTLCARFGLPDGESAT